VRRRAVEPASSAGNGWSAPILGNSYYPSLDKHLPIIIGPYIKGSEDKPPAGLSALPELFLHRLPQFLVRHVQVALRRLQIRVTEKELNRSEIEAPRNLVVGCEREPRREVSFRRPAGSTKRLTLADRITSSTKPEFRQLISTRS